MSHKLQGWDGGFVGQSMRSWDRYQQCAALAEADRLDALVTDLWYPWDRRWLASLGSWISRLLKVPLEGCYSEFIPTDLIHLCPHCLIYTLISKAARSTAWFQTNRHKIYFKQGQELGRATGRLARRLKSAPFAHNYYGESTFEAAGNHTPRILFQTHPHAYALHDLYRQELDGGGPGARDLLSETEMRWEDDALSEMTQGAFLADAIIAASTYTKNSLIYAGVEEDKIQVVPYGVDLRQFMFGYPNENAKFRFIFVGKPVARKGAGYLLQAWKKAGLTDAELVFVGQPPTEPWLLEAISQPGIHRLGWVPTPHLAYLMKTSHVLLLPSLAEGFGLVLLEALACGTPFVATSHTGAPEILRHGEVGWLVNTADTDDLVERLRWCYEHRDTLRALRPRCRRIAERFTWTRFRRGIRHALGINGREN